MSVSFQRALRGGAGLSGVPMRQPAPHSLSSRDPKLACIFVEQVPRKGLSPERVRTSYRKGSESFDVARKVTFLGKGERDQPGTERVYRVYPSGKFSEEVIRVDEFAKERLEKTAKKSEYKEDSFSYATSVWNGASNVSAVVRNIFWIQNGVDPNPGITAGLGYTSAGGIISGPINVMDGLAQLKKAKKIGDVAGERLAKINVAKGGLEFASGGVMAASRTVSLASIHTTSKTMQVAGSVLGTTSTAITVSIFSIYALRFLRTLVGAIKMLKGITGKSDKDAVSALLAKLSLKVEDYDKALEVIKNRNAADLIKLESESIELTEEEKKIFQKEEKEEIERKISAELEKIDRRDPQYIMVLDWDKVERNLALKYKKELARMKMVKEVEYERIIGSKSLELIKSSYSAEVLTDAKKAEIAAAAQKELANHVVMYGLLLFATLIGIASFILTTIYTGGATLVVAYVMMLVMNIILTSADTQSLFKTALSLKEASTKQKVLMALTLFFIIGVTSVGAFFTGGGSMLVTALVVGALMTSIQAGGMYYAWTKHSKKELTDKKEFGMLGVGPAYDSSRKVSQLSRRRRRAVRNYPKGLSV